MATTWDKALFDAAYSLLGEPNGHPNTRTGIRLHYCRAAMYPIIQRRAQQLIEVLGLTTTDRILLVACGFGWTVEVLAGLGYTVVGTDTSAYIHSSKTTSEDTDIRAAITDAGLDPTTGEGLTHLNRLKGDGVRTRATILNEDNATTSSRNRVRSALGRAPTVIITENLMSCLTDAEGLVLHTNLSGYSASVRIVHLLTEFANTAPPFNFNSKSIDDWKLLFPTATIVADGYTFVVV